MICVPISTLIQTIVINYMNEKTHMTLGLVCIWKVTGDMISSYFKFCQNNFDLAIFGLYIDAAMSKGTFTMFTLLLKTVVDE